MNNLEIMEAGWDVPQEARNPISGGRLNGKTDINPMWRIRRLTEIFGPCGIGWWYVIKDQRLVPGAKEEIKAFVDIDLYYKWGDVVSQPIPGVGGNTFCEAGGKYTSDECFKMALTDAISVAAKALGIGGSIYAGEERTKYSRPAEAPRPAENGGPSRAPAPTEDPPQKPMRADDPQDLRGTVPVSMPDGYFYCKGCGKPIKAHGNMSDYAVAELSLKEFGKQLCMSCGRAEYKRRNA